MLVMPPPLWTPRNRTVVRPSIPAHWRRGPHHRPHCPLYNMADGDASLNSSGDTILDANGDEYVKCCCTCGICAPAGPATLTATISGSSLASCCSVASFAAGYSLNPGSTMDGTYLLPISATLALRCNGSVSTSNVTGTGYSSSSCSGTNLGPIGATVSYQLGTFVSNNSGSHPNSLVISFLISITGTTIFANYIFSQICTGSATVAGETGFSTASGITPGSCTVSF